MINAIYEILFFNMGNDTIYTDTHNITYIGSFICLSSERLLTQPHMSLDVYLTVKEKHKKPYSGIFIRENGSTKEITEEEWKERFPDREPVRVIMDDVETNEVYSANITHNMGKMADKAGVYEALWRPEEKGWTVAKDLIDVLEFGLANLKGDPTFYKQFNPDNRWGDYDGLVSFVESYLNACKEYPEAEIRVWR